MYEDHTEACLCLPRFWNENDEQCGSDSVNKVIANDKREEKKWYVYYHSSDMFLYLTTAVYEYKQVHRNTHTNKYTHYYNWSDALWVGRIFMLRIVVECT